MQTLDRLQADATDAPAAPSPGGARLLVVMAETPLALLVQSLLSGAGHDAVRIAPRDLDGAIDRFDVAVVEETEARAEGSTLVPRLAARGRVLVLAGYGEAAAALELFRAGASEYLVMPLEGPERFLASVAALSAAARCAGPAPDPSGLAPMDVDHLPAAIQDALVVLRGALRANR